MNTFVNKFILACSVCFGDQGSSLTQSYNIAIIFLLIVVFLVLVGFGLFFLQIQRKLRKLNS